MKTITKLSPAKINLTLDILSKKEGENFHGLKTIYHKVSLADEMIISESDKFEIMGEFDFPMESNLIFKAWKLIEKFVSSDDFNSVKVEVKKNIPEGGGLGGGSSNFATFVQGYFELFGLGKIPQKLIDESGEIGKDIPFFFEQKSCAVGLGFGDEISAVPFDSEKFKGMPIFIYRPDFANSTPEMFGELKNFDTNFTADFLRNPELENCGNGFDQFLLEEKYKNLFMQESPKVYLAGSGSCFFSFEKVDVKDCEVFECSL